MKNKMKILGLILIASLGFVSCEEDQIDQYNSGNNVYFTWAETGAYFGSGSRTKVDSVGFSFALLKGEIKEMLVKVPIAVQGKVTDKDRTINVVVDESSTAIKGTHFDMPDNIVFRSGQAFDSIPVTFLRTDEMKNQKYNLVLRLEPNENFSTDFQQVLNGQEFISVVKVEISINDIAQAPQGWYTFYLGDFTAKKVFLMSDLLGIDPSIFEARPPLGELLYYGTFMQRYLNEQSAMGNTILEDDGTPMIMGPNVQ